MKKILFSMVLILSLILFGCGETEKENLGGTVESNENGNVEENQSENNDDANDEVNASENNDDNVEDEKIDQLIVDNDDYKATLLEIVKKKDDIFGDTIEVVYEIENKLDYTIGVQARSVSADGYMIDESTFSMSQEVAAGKKAKAVLSIHDFEGYDFPELNEDFEMGLHFFNYDSFEDISEHEVSVSF